MIVTTLLIIGACGFIYRMNQLQESVNNSTIWDEKRVSAEDMVL